MRRLRAREEAQLPPKGRRGRTQAAGTNFRDISIRHDDQMCTWFVSLGHCLENLFFLAHPCSRAFMRGHLDSMSGVSSLRYLVEPGGIISDQSVWSVIALV